MTARSGTAGGDEAADSGSAGQKQQLPPGTAEDVMVDLCDHSCMKEDEEGVIVLIKTNK